VFDLISLLAFLGVGGYMIVRKTSDRIFYLSLAGVFIFFFLLGLLT